MAWANYNPRVKDCLSALAVLAATIVAPGAAETTDRLSRTVPLAAATPIRVDASVADVTITGSDRQDVAVEIVRRAPTAADLAKYPALIEERDGVLHVSAAQIDDGKDAALKTEIAIAVPSMAVLQAVRVFEGRVRLTNLKGQCDVEVRRGPIEASGIAGHVRLESELGSIDIRQFELTPGGMMRLRVFNGVVRARFPKVPANGRILAVTFNGTLESDIPLTMKDRFGPRFGETTIGSGDPVMSIDVVKGDIALTVGR